MSLPYGLVRVLDHYKGHGRCSTIGGVADVESGGDNGVGIDGYRTLERDAQMIGP